MLVVAVDGQAALALDLERIVALDRALCVGVGFAVGCAVGYGVDGAALEGDERLLAAVKVDRGTVGVGKAHAVETELDLVVGVLLLACVDVDHAVVAGADDLPVAALGDGHDIALDADTLARDGDAVVAQGDDARVFLPRVLADGGRLGGFRRCGRFGRRCSCRCFGRFRCRCSCCCFNRFRGRCSCRCFNRFRGRCGCCCFNRFRGRCRCCFNGFRCRFRRRSSLLLYRFADRIACFQIRQILLDQRRVGNIHRAVAVDVRRLLLRVGQSDRLRCRTLYHRDVGDADDAVAVRVSEQGALRCHCR